MNIVIVGPGSLGCLLASLLASAGDANVDGITVLDRNPQRAEHIANNGIRYHHLDQEKDIHISATADPGQIGSVDVLAFCVKSYDLDQAFECCKPLLRKQPLVLLLQNGIGHLRKEIVTRIGNPAFVTTTEGATLLGPGHVRHAGSGITHLGFLEKPEQKSYNLLSDCIGRLKAAGMDTHYSPDILVKIWQKLIINCCINGPTVIHNCANGELLQRPVALSEMKKLYDEATATAAAKDIHVSNTFEDILAVCRGTATNISSMLQDVRKKKRTEIDAINGAIVHEAASKGVSVPANTKLVQQIKDRERIYF